MKSTLLLACLFWLVVSPQLGFSQTYRPNNDCAFLTSKRIFHYVNDDLPLQAAELKDLPLTQRFVPVKPAAFHPIEVAESERAYADGRFADAVAAVAQVATLRPADPTVLHCYARALYRQEETRNQSYPVYQRLIALLNGYGQEGPEVVSIYTLFLEAYFKLATLQLDHAQWAAASYNLSRAAAVMQSLDGVASENRLMREQILQYQTECFAHLGNAPLCRYFGRRTLQAFPENQYVLEYLARLPTPKKSPTPRR
ncbi:hypothetical protein KB206_17080 [Microvirga sp. STS02]|uniref:hypothetical protein n=1 Tax=Hymenobacter negativus TaxID=2795026 RepID=UPI0018DB78EC|nr:MULTISPECIES: hypothetical protein [Bacteria]MBH8570609.1 hypothetical protein [Hymenobacter negativus]MBR7210347.1 hypothetical protein [Microvirga sp. STS02]